MKIEIISIVGFVAIANAASIASRQTEGKVAIYKEPLADECVLVGSDTFLQIVSYRDDTFYSADGADTRNKIYEYSS
jgi:hypothetical protein